MYLERKEAKSKMVEVHLYLNDYESHQKHEPIDSPLTFTVQTQNSFQHIENLEEENGSNCETIEAWKKRFIKK